MRAIARIISAICNPLCIFLYVVCFVLFVEPHSFVQWPWLLFTGSCVLACSVYILFGVHKKWFSNTDVSVQTERPKMFLGIGVFLFLYMCGLFLFPAPQLLRVMSVCIFCMVCIQAGINIFVKMSGHMAYLTAGLFFIVLYTHGSPLLFLLLPCVAWSRIFLKRHTKKEILVGFCVGMFVVFMLAQIYKP